MKRKRLVLLFLCVIIPFLSLFQFLSAARKTLAGPPTAVNPVQEQTQQKRLDEALQSVLDTAAPDESIRFIIHLNATADLSRFTKDDSLDVQTRRAGVVQQLQQTAAASQAPLIAHLATLQASGQIGDYQPLWIINAIAAKGTADAIHQLATRPDVAQLALDAPRSRIPSPLIPSADTWTASPAGLDSNALSWGIERIRANYVWDGLGINGQGVTIGIMDSGVDWLHPALYNNYRGNMGSSITHAGNWYDAINPANDEPTDYLGHGTHVAGTTVGQNGIGVAPGAQWIAVAIADPLGLIYDSAVHAGFQWLMAPNGDPALAPDVINNSWGGSGEWSNFLEDVLALHAAGIVPVFAAGNNGPFPGTIGSPASYPDTLAVGASDDTDTVAWFSSRGPSPLTADLKPWLSAPGTHIRSALPGGQFGYATGTSMATPHVAGTIALLLSANPTLSRQAIMQRLAESAVPMEGPIPPNSDSGWGRLDAYQAVAPQVATGYLQGIVSSNGLPLPHVMITLTTPSGVSLAYQTDENGFYQAILRPGTYQVNVAPFGYVPGSIPPATIQVGQTTTRNINLSPLPTGVAQGFVRQAGTTSPLAATLTVVGTPHTVHTERNGHYTISLPAGQYEFIVSANGYRLGRATVTIAAGYTTTRYFNLTPAPSLLLVDSGQWYYASYRDYFQTALADDQRAYDLWSISDPFSDIPTTADLAPYDIVIWSDPYYSPGYIGANNVITNYLGLGGNLLISGQNVGSYDGSTFSQAWWYRQLQASLTGQLFSTSTLTVTGAPGTSFAGLTLHLNDPGSAANQMTPDTVRPRQHSLTTPTFYYGPDQVGGLQAGDCDPFRIVYLGFGLEGVAEAADRQAIIERSIAAILSPRPTIGVQWASSDVDDFAVPGDHLTYTLRLRNLSTTITDTFHLHMSDTNWSTTLVTPTLTLGPCQIGETTLVVNVPASVPSDSTHTMQVTAVSTANSSTTAHLHFHYKVPGHILLVDDDRWYNQETVFTAALDSMKLTYDVWNVGWDNNVRGSPPDTLLNAYDIVIWYTGYDWFAPVTFAERVALTEFMSQGGRLFLTSQDFLYYHAHTSLARHFLGVLSHQESITPTQIYAGDNIALPHDLAGPLPLLYPPYKNFSDGLIPAAGSLPFLWHDQGMAAGIANTGPGWRSVFWSIPFEKLPTEQQAAAMNGVVGWLSDLGDSTFLVDRRTGDLNSPRTFTLTVRNNADSFSNQVWVTNTLPAGLNLVPASISGGATYDPASHQLTWQGMLAAGASHQIRYQAVPDSSLANGTRLDNRVTLYYERHGLAFDRMATLWVRAPDLSGSALSATSAEQWPEQTVTYTLRLENSGLAATNLISAVVRLPDTLSPLTDTLHFSAGSGALVDHRILWQGNLAPGAATTVSLVLTRTVSLDVWWLSAAAVLQDGVTDTLIRPNILYLPPPSHYLPFIAKS